MARRKKSKVEDYIGFVVPGRTQETGRRRKLHHKRVVDAVNDGVPYSEEYDDYEYRKGPGHTGPRRPDTQP